jgi:hypothetical protein
MRRFPINASAGLLCQQHCEPRSKANLRIFGTPDAIVLYSDDKIVRPLSQFDLNRATPITGKRVLQGVGHHLLHDDRSADTLSTTGISSPRVSGIAVGHEIETWSSVGTGRSAGLAPFPTMQKKGNSLPSHAAHGTVRRLSFISCLGRLAHRV